MKDKKEDIKNKNIRNLLFGQLFIIISCVLISFFLPFYLKEKGLGILEIGFLFTIGIAAGNLIMSLIYSRILKKIKLKTGLLISSLFGFMYSFMFFIIPGYSGIIFSKIFGEAENISSKISNDVAYQHNTDDKNKRTIVTYSLFFEAVGMVIGFILSVILISYIGFVFSAFIFSLITIPAFFFYGSVKEETRFRSNHKSNKLKLSKKLKLLALTEILYWLALSSSFALVITFLVRDKFSGSIIWLAILFSGLYISITITSLVTKKFLDKSNLYKTSILGMFILLLSALVIIFSNNLYVVLFAMILEGIGGAIWVPSKTALYWKETSPALREKASGFVNGFRTFMNTIGPLVGGFLVTYFNILAPFYFKASICLTCIILYFYIFKSK